MTQKYWIMLLLLTIVAAFGCNDTIDHSHTGTVDTLKNSSKSDQTSDSSDTLTVAKKENHEPREDRFGFIEDSLNVVEKRVQWGDSFYELLIPYTTPKKIDYLQRTTREVFNVNRINHGDRYRIYTDTERDTLIGWVHHEDRLNYNVIHLQEDTVKAFSARKSIDTLSHTAHGSIRTSLYHTIKKQGLPQELVMKLADLYAWEIDFFALRKGDRFRLLYEELQVDGEHYEYGDIVAAEFVHEGESFKAFKFQYEGQKSGGYYDENGASLQKALLKAPLQYSRVSSRFSHNRLHPILHRRMPHRGIDYAAPSGTPVVSVGDGKVIEADYRGANGNIVKIRHNTTYTSVYLHLRGFARGIHRGAEVEQGQTIGYVGSTGRSTGPHLDYRVYKHGSPVDPMSINPPSTDDVPDSLYQEYEKNRDSLRRKLEAIEDENKFS